MYEDILGNKVSNKFPEHSTPKLARRELPTEYLGHSSPPYYHGVSRSLWTREWSKLGVNAGSDLQAETRPRQQEEIEMSLQIKCTSRRRTQFKLKLTATSRTNPFHSDFHV